MKVFKKLLSVFFSTALVLSLILNSQNVNAEEIAKNKAIIILPGTFGSGLFYRGETCTKYFKNEAVWMPLDDNSKWRMVKGVAKFKLFYSDLCCDEDGKAINKDTGLPLENEKFPHSVDSDVAKYGVGNSCKKLIETLTKELPDYKVFLHNYDWRLNIDEAARSLTKEIQKYDEVILIGYSLGGLVASKSAVQLKEIGKLNKIKKFVAVAVPFNGTVEPFYVLKKGMVTEDDFMGKVIEFLGVPNIIKTMAKNCGITYQMLPSKDYFEKAKHGYIADIKGRTLNYEETLSFLKSCDFAKKSDGNVKPFLSEPQKFYDSLKTDGKHILNYLDYHLIVGYGLNTMSELIPDFKKQGDIIIKSYVDGDGSIALNESAIPFDDIDENRVFKVKGRHQFLIGDKKVIENIINTIKNKPIESFEQLELVA